MQEPVRGAGVVDKLSAKVEDLSDPQGREDRLFGAGNVAFILRGGIAGIVFDRVGIVLVGSGGNVEISGVF